MRTYHRLNLFKVFDECIISILQIRKLKFREFKKAPAQCLRERVNLTLFSTEQRKQYRKRQKEILKKKRKIQRERERARGMTS